ncbi:hypothetical protein [Asticcacaulis machinosus]|uniref:Cytochrome d ubiquinol oxidase subunit II n=1 Tax=Asticcacaulis machinosus TaxID=2984211 RepID=A0ABT5HL32_9CAUL|nr:hypothetical protein [Asticcacaulis machinosus]MDC7676949.1 hypothetical protein [Asticcacaulis machinosus]
MDYSLHDTYYVTLSPGYFYIWLGLNALVALGVGFWAWRKGPKVGAIMLAVSMAILLLIFSGSVWQSFMSFPENLSPEALASGGRKILWGPLLSLGVAPLLLTPLAYGVGFWLYRRCKNLKSA